MKKILILFALLITFNSFAQRRQYSSDSDKPGIVLAVGGVAFSAAAIIEGPHNYGTWNHNPNNTSSYNMTYTTPPFWKQTPRNIMLGVGLTLTITGLISLASHK